MSKSNLFAPVIFLAISLIITLIWFRDGLIFGGAEVGIFTYNPFRSLQIQQFVWWGDVAPGQLVPHFIAGVPFYLILSALRLIFSPVVLQALFFLLLLILMGYGMYLYLLSILGKEKQVYAFLGGLFYMFNSYIMVQVWHRFVYSTMLLAAVLPFFILFWSKWIKEGRFINLIIFLLINFLTSYIYGNLASIITVWIILILISLSEIVFPWVGKMNGLKIGIRFFIGLLFWLLTNIWWLLPTFTVTPALLGEQHSSEDNLGTLVVISRQTIMPYLLQLANPFYLFYRQELGQIYLSFTFKLMPWIISAVIFLGLVVSLKLKIFARYAFIFIIVLLFSKGAAIPFSYPYIFGFERFFALGVLRNPFEKLGIMLPLFGSILFVLGLQYLFKLRQTKLLATATIIVLFVYAWPMFTGQVFKIPNYSLKVSVPESYKQADMWFRQQNDKDGVILHLPLSGKDVVTYYWSSGYHGVDQNEILFSSRPSLSRNVGVKRVDDTLKSLSYISDPTLAENQNQILELLQSFNIKYVVLHKDIKWEDKDTYGEIGKLLEPNKIENILNNLSFLKKETNFGSLVIYQLTDGYYKQIITLTDDIQIVYPAESRILQILSLTKNQGTIVTPINDKVDDVPFQASRQTLIFPNSKIEYLESSRSAQLARLNATLQNLYSQQSPFNQLLQIKAYLDELGNLQSSKLTQEIILSTEKILRIYQQGLMNNGLASSNLILDYKKSIESIFTRYSKNLNLHRLFNSYIADTLRLHLFVLKNVKGGENISKLLEDKMVVLDFLPQYRADLSHNNPEEEIYRQILKFFIPKTQQYELILKGGLKDIWINGKNVILDKRSKDLSVGTYEISYKTPDELVLKAGGIDNYQPYEGEILTFKKESPTVFSGKVTFKKPVLLFFKQTFHPGWVLSLIKEGKIYKVDKHFLGNLYGNAWWLDQSGEYDFRIEFMPQRNVQKGTAISAVSGLFVVFLSFFVKRKVI